MRNSFVSLGSICARLGTIASVSLMVIHCNNPSESPGTIPNVFTPTFSATSAEVRDFLGKGGGGTHAKLVFIDRTSTIEQLCYIDFAEGTTEPIVHIIAEAKAAEVPVISPDGNWVVYASGSGTEAGSPVSARSSVYLTKLAPDAHPILVAADSACEPRFVQNNSGKLTVVFSTLAPNFGWEGFGKTVEIDIDLSSSEPIPSTKRILNPNGSYTAGLSWDERYLSGGGGHVAILDLDSGKGHPDTASYDLVQSCNASASSSRIFTNTLMYLNTNGTNAKIDSGKPWGEWQTIIIGNSKKQLIKGYTFPATYKFPIETEPKSYTGTKWHHCEWSNHPHFATATLNVERYFKTQTGYANTGYQERIYVVNLRDSTYLEVLRPDKVRFTGKSFDASGFYWPWLWVEVPIDFKESPIWLKP
jgi:hypothetical protein